MAWHELCMAATRSPLWGILPSGWQVLEQAGWTTLLGLFWSELSHGPLSKFVVHMMTYKFH